MSFPDKSDIEIEEFSINFLPVKNNTSAEGYSYEYEITRIY